MAVHAMGDARQIPRFLRQRDAGSEHKKHLRDLERSEPEKGRRLRRAARQDHGFNSEYREPPNRLCHVRATHCSITGRALSYNAYRRASPGCNKLQSHNVPHPHVAPKTHLQTTARSVCGNFAPMLREGQHAPRWVKWVGQVNPNQT